ncbi:MAG: 2-C-methyl-D-erythritol 2,4-cyclodiphosphate synthase [Deltaproteobacteria bacterium]|nr:2-C-methyl-D-erythritol 2,4-cyclodiphosphate synthase [Candidatus Zymogenaceae bacterium]
MIVTGIGYDVHRLVRGRKLILGGVTVPYPKGLLGHSDADVLAHAVTDALLGAGGMGDIGRLFPDSDPAYKDADSLKLLASAWRKVADRGFMITHIDAVIIAQRPKLFEYIPHMEENIARALDVAVDAVNVKATTTEKLGFEGKGKGIASWAVATLTGGDR